MNATAPALARMQALFLLLTEPQPEGAANPLIEALVEGGEETQALAGRERCLPNLLDLLAQRRALDDAERKTRERLRTLHVSAGVICAELPEDVVLLKGANIHRLYPVGAARYSGDVDVMLRDYSALGALQAYLKQHGYVSAGSGLWGFRTEPKLRHGLASLRYAIPDQASSTVSVEVQIGGYPITVERAVGFDELCREVKRLPGRPYRTLAHTPQVLLAIADFVGRTSPISIRHLADLSLVVRQADSDIDIDYLRARIRALNLRSGVDKLMLAARSKGLEAALPQALRSLAQTPRAPTARPSARYQASPAPGDLPASGDDPPPPRARPIRRAIAVTLLGAARFAQWLRPESLLTAAFVSRAGLVRLALDAGYRVFGIQISHTPMPTTTVINADGGLYLSGGGGVYALSLGGRCTAESRRWLFQRLRTASAPALISRQ